MTKAVQELPEVYNLMKKKQKWCLDCNRVFDTCDWCDICEGYLCLDCKDVHDCLGEILEDDEEELEEPEDEDLSHLFDSMMEDDSDDDGSSDA